MLNEFKVGCEHICRNKLLRVHCGLITGNNQSKTLLPYLMNKRFVNNKFVASFSREFYKGKAFSVH